MRTSVVVVRYIWAGFHTFAPNKHNIHLFHLVLKLKQNTHTHINKEEYGCLFPISALDNKNVYKRKRHYHMLFLYSQSDRYLLGGLLFLTKTCFPISIILMNSTNVYCIHAVSDLVIGQENSLIIDHSNKKIQFV